MERETHQSFHLVPPLTSACTRIDMQKVQFTVGHDFEYVGVTADEDTIDRRSFLQDFFHPERIFSGIPADMCHKNGYSVTFEVQVEREKRSDACVVYIAIHPPEWLEVLKFAHEIHTSEVAGMPHFVTFGKMPENSCIQFAVCIGEQAYPGHLCGTVLCQVITFASKMSVQTRHLYPVLCLLLLTAACQRKPSCKYKPAPVFEAGLPHVLSYQYQQDGSRSLETLELDRGILLEITQEVCADTRQEFRFTVPGNFASMPDSLWLREASRQFVYLSSFSEKQSALQAWGDVIEQMRGDMKLGEDREVEPGVFVRVDKVVSPEQGILMVVLSQKG